VKKIPSLPLEYVSVLECRVAAVTYAPIMVLSAESEDAKLERKSIHESQPPPHSVLFTCIALSSDRVTYRYSHVEKRP
jgi:hypothetical protein